jgi:anti-sigma factor RsiW
MTCAENRELHSALLDGELRGDERALVEGHLAGCPECARELERLARMLGMLHALPAARAPLGFVDRVLEAARPAPWYARLGRRVLQPWRVKLPLQAAALVVVALGAVYVYQKTPELQQAARYEAPAPTSPTPSAPPPAAREPGAPAPARAPEPPAGSKAAERQEPAPRADSPELAKRESDTGARDASRSNVIKDAPPPATPAPAAPAEAERAREKKADAPEPAPRTQAEDRSSRLGEAAPSAPLQSRMLVAPDASGRLAVDDREAAERALAELRARLGVAESFRRDAGEGGVLIELVVPRQGYADFARGLAAIGRWTADREPAGPPEQIRLQILLVR